MEGEYQCISSPGWLYLALGKRVRRSNIDQSKLRVRWFENQLTCPPSITSRRPRGRPSIAWITCIVISCVALSPLEEFEDEAGGRMRTRYHHMTLWVLSTDDEMMAYHL